MPHHEGPAEIVQRFVGGAQDQVCLSCGGYREVEGKVETFRGAEIIVEGE